jgi:hypothetical protein
LNICRNDPQNKEAQNKRKKKEELLLSPNKKRASSTTQLDSMLSSPSLSL